MSANRLAIQSGTALSVISRIESGETPTPTPEVLKRIANALELDLAVLFGLRGIPITPPRMTLAAFLEQTAGFPLPESAVREADAAIHAIVVRYRPERKKSGRESP